MKLKDLFEGPYHIPDDSNPNIKMDSYPSLEGLRRNNTLLDTISVGTTDYHFWVHPNSNAKVTTEKYDKKSKENRQLVVVHLKFEQKADLPVKKQLQVDSVYTHPDEREQFLAGALYILLAMHGYSVVSDILQYNGGKGLWKRISKEADSVNCIVKIWDETANDWIKDEKGNPLKYNANNLGDDKIWHTFSLYDTKTTLLVLQKR